MRTLLVSTSSLYAHNGVIFSLSVPANSQRTSSCCAKRLAPPIRSSPDHHLLSLYKPNAHRQEVLYRYHPFRSACCFFPQTSSIIVSEPVKVYEAGCGSNTAGDACFLTFKTWLLQRVHSLHVNTQVQLPDSSSRLCPWTLLVMNVSCNPVGISIKWSAKSRPPLILRP